MSAALRTQRHAGSSPAGEAKFHQGYRFEWWRNGNAVSCNLTTSGFDSRPLVRTNRSAANGQRARSSADQSRRLLPVRSGVQILPSAPPFKFSRARSSAERAASSYLAGRVFDSSRDRQCRHVGVFQGELTGRGPATPAKRSVPFGHENRALSSPPIAGLA